MVTKRHLLLLCRAALSDTAKVTLLEIMLHLAANRRVPSLNDLSKVRARVKSAIQSDIEELVKAKILKKLRLLGAGNSVEYAFNEDALAHDCGFDSFSEVDFTTFLQEFHGGALAKAVQRGEERPSALSHMKVLVKEEGKLTERDLLYMFAEVYRSIFGQKYKHEQKEMVRLKSLRQEFGSTKVADMITDFLTYRNLHRGTPFTIAGLWERRNMLAKRLAKRGNNGK